LLFFYKLRVRYVSKYPEISEIWFLACPYLFRGYDPFLIVTGGSVM
jgi:hypothetical protein